MRIPVARFTPRVIAVFLAVGCGSTQSPAPNPTSSAAVPSASIAALATPAWTPVPVPTTRATASPSLPALAATASLPVRGSAREIGEQVLMAPGPDGGLYVSIPRARGAILALLDRSGRPRPGWPMTIDKATVCDTLLPVDDGSVRVVCDGTDLPRFDNDMSDVRAFAFMPDGRPLAGWPVRLRPGTGELVGGELTILSIQPLTDTVEIGQISREARITTVGSRRDHPKRRARPDGRNVLLGELGHRTGCGRVRDDGRPR